MNSAAETQNCRRRCAGTRGRRGRRGSDALVAVELALELGADWIAVGARAVPGGRHRACAL